MKDTLKIMAKVNVSSLRTIAEECDREQALEIYRQILRLAQRLAEKHKIEKEKC